jgi:hypothetical protein
MEDGTMGSPSFATSFCHLLGVPPEILVELFNYLMHTDLCRLQEVRSPLRMLSDIFRKPNLKIFCGFSSMGSGEIITVAQRGRSLSVLPVPSLRTRSGVLAAQSGGDRQQGVAAARRARLWRYHRTKH